MSWVCLSFVGANTQQALAPLRNIHLYGTFLGFCVLARGWLLVNHIVCTYGVPLTCDMSGTPKSRHPNDDRG